MNRLKLFSLVIATVALTLLAPIARADTARPSDSINVKLSYQQPPPTVSPWSGAIFGSIRGKSFQTNAVVINKIVDLTRHGFPVGMELDGFVGTTVDKNGKSVGGFAVGKTWYAFDQASFYLGFGASIAVNESPRVGVLAGLSVHF